LMAEASIFEQRHLLANALAHYIRLRQKWPEAPWIKTKIYELQVALADEAAAKRSATSGRTFALLVGVSKYLKPELNLQYAHADAIAFSKLLQRPQNGPVLADDILLLTDEKATTSAIRLGFQEFLGRRAGKDDTVVILVAGHGIVEPEGEKRAFIVTYD